jgi:hypothetical protein
MEVAGTSEDVSKPFLEFSDDDIVILLSEDPTLMAHLHYG